MATSKIRFVAGPGGVRIIEPRPSVIEPMQRDYIPHLPPVFALHDGHPLIIGYTANLVWRDDCPHCKAKRCVQKVIGCYEHGLQEIVHGVEKELN